MEWSRVKNILIVLLTIVNVFLLVAYASSSLREQRIEMRENEDVCSVLKKLNFSIDAQIIPRNTGVLYPARAIRDSTQEQRIMDTILGNTKVTRLGSGTVTYTGNRGNARVRTGGYFEITLKPEQAITNEEQMQKLAKDLARELNMDIVGENMQVERDVSGFRLSVIQKIIGVPIYNCRLSIWSLPDNIVKVSGRYMPNQLTILRGKPPYSVNGLLLNLVEELHAQGIMRGKIEKLEAGYCINTAIGGVQNETAYAIPVWRIRIDGHDWSINAMNGKSIIVD